MGQSNYILQWDINLITTEEGCFYDLRGDQEDMINICSKRQKIYIKQKEVSQEREISISAVSRDSNATSTSNKIQSERTNKEIKGINQHYNATSLDSRKMFNKSILQSQICTGCVSERTALKQDFVSLKTRSYANQFLRLWWDSA